MSLISYFAISGMKIACFYIVADLIANHFINKVAVAKTFADIGM